MPLSKSWRWVGAFGPSAMLCVASARVGLLRRSWWALWDGERLREGSRGIDAVAGRVLDGDVMIDLHLASPLAPRSPGAAAPERAATGAAGAPIEVTTGPAWTRKTPLAVRGTVRIGARSLELDCGGLLDESAGRHARRTAWRWSAGAGVAASGASVVWNLVEGLHDGSPSERTVWVDGVPHEVPHQPFDDLTRVGDLTFTALATRARRENYLVIASDYAQPFGTFAGTLPVAGPLRAGWGVMERHEARW